MCVSSNNMWRLLNPLSQMSLHVAFMCCVSFASTERAFFFVTLQGVWPLEGEQLGPGETREQWLFFAAGPRVPPDH